MNLKEIQQAASKMETERAQNQAQLLLLAGMANDLNNQIQALQLKGSLTDSEKLSLDSLKSQAARLQLRMTATRKTFATSKLKRFQEFQDLFQDAPQQLIEQLTDDLPIVLFPVRIETHFHSENNKHELWVRIYPDDITTFTHENELTADEITAGETYWKSVWETRMQPEDDGKKTRETLWASLANRFGVNRAAWVARQTKPTNWYGKWRLLPELILKTQDPPKPQAWSQAPHTRLMPSRFVFMAYSPSGKAFEVVGKPVPDYLVMGPDPLLEESAFSRDANNKLVIGKEMAWLFDFEEAVAVGMAVKIPLTVDWVHRGFEKLVVLGIHFTSDATQSKDLLENLFQNHTYSAGGFGILPQGTPTNNTDKAASGFSDADRTGPQLETPDGVPLFKPTPDFYQQTDGQRFAEALGISTESMSFTENAQRADIAEALSMNNALWPATWGMMLDDLLKPLVTRKQQDLARQFFTEFVTGRGFLPAIRVGNQPYGVLVTSSLNDWQFTVREMGADREFWGKLLQILRQLSVQYSALLPKVAFAGKAGDANETLLNIIGLQASSVVFHSRKAVTDLYAWNYLNFQKSNFLSNILWNAINAAKSQQLNRLTFDVSKDFLLEKLIFLSKTDELNGPVIDADPRTPFSETAPIQPYDGTNNYIDWLLKSDLQTVKNQSFRDKDNNPTAAPRALLYQLLRRAYLEEFGQSITKWLVNQQFIDDSPLEKQIQNIGSLNDLSKEDFLQLNASKVRLGNQNVAVGDYIRTLIPKPGTAYNGPTEMIPLMGVVKALQTLKNLPTARLERLFAEHLDLCSYRLDGWQTGLFARRLYNLQHASDHSYQSKGTYLGAYGWVENLRANTAKQAFPQTNYPKPLQEPDNKPIYEDASNGGYIQTPSLRHAVTAAVLRNAYLSQGSDNPRLAVNLSSERVRMAMTYLEGIQNGQDLAALLGYQFERGLHDRSLFLNQYIYVLRARFPLISKKLTDVPDSAAQEVIEARNVINGYDLLEYARTHPQLQGIAGLPAPNSTEMNQILAELDRLNNALDALADLSLSESVFQVVQGNFDRAGGMLQAISEGKMPPEPEIVETPRSGTSITHRVAVCLQTTGVVDRHPAWGATASPRGKANRFVNHWLGERLPKPADIRFGYQTGTVDDTLSLAQFDLQPLDLVLMAGAELGNLSSKLERWLIYQIRQNFNVSDQQAIQFTFSPTGQAVSLGGLLPLLNAMKKIVTEARPLHALDFFPQTSAYLEGEPNPQGYQDLAVFRAQLEADRTNLESLTAILKSKTAVLKTALEQARTSQQPTVELAKLTSVRASLSDLASYGWTEALPNSTTGNTVFATDELLAQAEGMVSFFEKVTSQNGFDGFEALTPERQVERCREVARQLYGKSFNWVPAFRFLNPSQLTNGILHSPDMLSQQTELVMENWLQTRARVRPVMENTETLAFHHDLYQEQPFALTPVQLPYVTGEKWVGETFSESQRNQDRLSLVLHQAPTDTVQNQAGFLLDEWNELIPTDKETTGVTFHFNRPNATPPQAILIAVAPVLNGKWTWLELENILTDTLNRSKLRAIEPDMLTDTDYFQVLPAVLNDFSTGGISTVFTNGSTLATS
ncbi:OmpH family outer membrane protein [Larkinella terrae]|uniref:Uncharacterized protein n=1 Tax=Larkinella terrae TaxID=2025311 RepID=A0A7K0EQ04_9BACT|nr:OmpH family outer membrane protein [Larkinella terrae]MRS63889.1 hypothetical protein [Larkinella terrae]